MHPQIIAMVAAEHVRDMQAEASRGRRARAARRARRGGPIAAAASSADLIVFREATGQDRCPESPAKAA